MFYPGKILTVSRIAPYAYPERVRRGAVKLAGGVTLNAGQILYETTTAQNCVQTLTISATGGSFSLLFPSQNGYDVVGPIAYNATAATLRANIQAAFDNYFGPSQAVITGTGPFTVTYSGNLVSNQDIPTPNVVNALTGGGASVTATQNTQGFGGIGMWEAYTAGSNTGFSYCILESNTRTAADGTIIDEHGSTGKQTAEALFTGEFIASQLIGIDTNLFPATNAFGAMGKFRHGQWNTYPTLFANSVVVIPGF